METSILISEVAKRYHAATAEWAEHNPDGALLQLQYLRDLLDKELPTEEVIPQETPPAEPTS